MLNVKSWRADLTGGIEQVRSLYRTHHRFVGLHSQIHPSPHFCRLGDGDEVVGLEAEFQILATKADA
jgi:hypothetical protein